MRRYCMSEEEKLVKKILSGDLRAFELFVDKYKRLVSHIVFRMVPDTAEKEDLCQDVFLKVYKNLKKFSFDAKISTWIAKITYNTCINYLEKKKAALYDDLLPEGDFEAALSNNSFEPTENTEENNVRNILKREISVLPVIYRTVLTLYHMDELSYTEISDVTELPIGTVKSYLFRARQLLKKRLVSKYSPEELFI